MAGDDEEHRGDVRSTDPVETRRLAVLRDYALMDTAPAVTLDAITRMASRLLGVPVALVSLLDEHRQWFKSRHGLAVAETPREVAFCDHVVRSQVELVVQDATADPRFRANPLVVDPPCIRFYAGVPLRVPEGVVLGTLCVLDFEPRSPSAEMLRNLRDLAELAVAQLVQHRRELVLGQASRELEQFRRFFETSQDLNCVSSLDGRFVALNRRWQEVLGFSEREMLGRPFLDFVHPEDVEASRQALVGLGASQAVIRFRNRYRCRTGEYRWFEWNALPAADPESLVFASARDVTLPVEAEEALKLQNGVLSLITDAQARFLTGEADRAWWSFVLDRLLSLTCSEYGFIGITGEDASGPFLRTKAITNISWDEPTRRLYEEREAQGMEFRNMRTLFGRAMVTRTRLIANDVSRHPHAAGRPHGHPPLNAFAGVPIFDGLKMVGLVGLANRPGGFSEAVIDAIEPVLAFFGAMLNKLALEEERQSFVAQLEAAKDLQARVLESSESGFLALNPDGSIALANRRAVELIPKIAKRIGRTETIGIEAAVADLFPVPAERDWILSLPGNSAESSLGPHDLQLQGSRERCTTVEVTVSKLRLGVDGKPGLLLTLGDLQQRAALDETLRRNASLEERVDQLRQQQRDNEMLSECVEYLQSCSTLEEGLVLVASYLEQLCPSANTALYASGESTGEGGMALRRAVLRFGAARAAEELTTAECWALRSRRAHGVWPGGHRLRCQHDIGVEPRATYCVPLFSLERNVGLFVVTFAAEVGAAGEDASEARMSQIVAMAQTISGALSTIALRESLQRMALMDELTELPNRRAFQIDVARSISRQRRAGRPFALCVLDIDRFKQINDRFGHDVGDHVLQQVADVLRHGFREGDMVARIGGEEFSILLTELDGEVVQRRLQALLQRIRASVSVDNNPVTASVGFVLSEDMPDSATYDALFKEADQALYLAKEGGRDRAERARPSAPSRRGDESQAPTG